VEQRDRHSSNQRWIYQYCIANHWWATVFSAGAVEENWVSAKLLAAYNAHDFGVIAPAWSYPPVASFFGQHKGGVNKTLYNFQ
jgi:hypothetical protein